MMQLLVASTNEKKLIELRKVLEGMPFELVSLKSFSDIEEVEENGSTFEENATLKACGYAQQTGLLTLAEDSGLCCDALDGAPGIYSARFSGEGDDGNNAKLLRLLEPLPDNCREAHYVSAICVASPESVVGVVRGEVHGYISHDLKGSNGFGYDPLFYYPPFEKTFGEVPAEMKDSVSHRAASLKKVKIVLEKYSSAVSE